MHVAALGFGLGFVVAAAIGATASNPSTILSWAVVLGARAVRESG